MPYVQRDENGNIIGTFALPQVGYAEEFLEELPPETPEQIVQRLDNAIESHIQSVISNLGYESLDRLVGVYSDSPNQTWKAEALGAKNWVTALWETALQIEQDVTNGTRPIPTEQELIAELPIITDYIVYPV